MDFHFIFMLSPCFQCVFNVVPQVHNMFLKGVPNSISFYPIWFAHSSPLLTYIGGPKGTYHIFTKKLLLLYGASKVSINFCKKNLGVFW
jgi:hypothetical protein